MALTVAQPPKFAEGIVKAKLPTLIDMLDSARGGAMPWLASTLVDHHSTRGLETSVGHRIFTFNAHDLAEHDAEARPQPVGWRYLILQGGLAVATVDLTINPTNPTEPPRFSSFTSGPFVNSIRSAIDQAETLDQVHNGTYQLRGLRIPSLRVAALWLHNLLAPEEAHDSDLVIPIKGSPTQPVSKRGGSDGTASGVQSYKLFLTVLGYTARSVLQHADATLSTDESSGPSSSRNDHGVEPPPLNTAGA